MGDEVHLWQIGASEQLTEIPRSPLNLESRLQEWLANDISILDPSLLVIGREVETDFGGFIDILCVDGAGDLVIVELKRDKTPREVTAQSLDYASWLVNLPNERVTAIADDYLDTGLEDAFAARFGADLPETLNGDHRILVVGSTIDASPDRIIRYLSDAHGVDINAATFQYFKLPDGSELLARVFLLERSEVQLNKRTRGSSKRRSNLSYEELEAQAGEAGVQDLYDQALNEFGALLHRGTTRSSVRFAFVEGKSRKVLISLIPGESNGEKGLRYQIYKHRLAHLANLSVAEVEAIMPSDHHEWTYGSPDAGPDWEGFEGFIKTAEEIDTLASAMKTRTAQI